jgi:hypothetical protein
LVDVNLCDDEAHEDGVPEAVFVGRPEGDIELVEVL